MLLMPRGKATAKNFAYSSGKPEVPCQPWTEEARLFVARGGGVRWWDEAIGMGGSLVRQRRRHMPRGRHD